MILQSADGKRKLDIGSGELVYSVYSTVSIRAQHVVPKVPLAIQFLQSGFCSAEHAQKTARQMNLIRDALSQVPPQEAVFDQKDMSKQAPWVGNLSPVITSCANLYTTEAGQDLLFEMVSLLAYADVFGVDISMIN